MSAELLRDLTIASFVLFFAWITYTCGYAQGMEAAKPKYKFEKTRAAFMGKK